MNRISVSLLAAFVMLLTAGDMIAQTKGEMTIKVFFHNEKMNPNMQDCNKAFPVTRKIPKTSSVATAALNELFRGTTPDEEAKQFSGFPAADTNGILKTVTVKNRVAFVNFNSRVLTQMGNATTSCGGAAFFGQVEKTLTQFPTIKRVIYAVEGNTDEFYEWVQVGECPYGKKLCAKTNFK